MRHKPVLVYKNCAKVLDMHSIEVTRHSGAHILAQALQELYPAIQLGIGPVIENGFFYDIKNDVAIQASDFSNIQNKMLEIIARSLPITKITLTKQEALQKFHNQFFKLEIINSLEENAIITAYQQGTFCDLCRGPHVSNTNLVPTSLMLTKLSGSYWRGDASGIQMQRIYGLLFTTQNELDGYLKRLEDMLKRDHRILGAKMNLFSLHEEAVGSVFWHHKGYVVYKIIENYMRQVVLDNQHIEVKTPQLVSSVLWQKSGHWEKFADNMFKIIYDNHEFGLKPMNCPCHVQIFNHTIRSYRELPIRMAEFGACHRSEPSGALYGIMRLRGFVQDDTHIFCTKDQVYAEAMQSFRLICDVYKAFGLTDMRIKYATRPIKSAGSDDVWQAAETTLSHVCEEIQKMGYQVEHNPGEGAFYGPKLEFVLRDAIGRDWQCGTLQVDFVLPHRLNAKYITPNGDSEYVIMLHRAMLGSLERFIAILLEHYEGWLPMWLAPVQVVCANVSDSATQYIEEIHSLLSKKHIRSAIDNRNEKIAYKIREHSIARAHTMLICGVKEVEARSVTIRCLQTSIQKTIPLDDAINELVSLAQQQCTKHV